LAWGNFDKFLGVYEFKIGLINLTPLSIGAGRSATSVLEGVDNPIVRMDGKVYIPGSSLKGVLRSEAEKYIRTVHGESPEYVCNILDPNDEVYGELSRKKRLKEKYEPCLICRLFGGPTVASHVKIFDAFPSRYVTEYRKCVSINRITGGQHAQRLFDIEYVVPNSFFDLTIEVENIDIMNHSDESKVIRYLIKKMVEKGIQVGSKKSTGFGKLKAERLTATRYYLDDGELKKEDVTKKLFEILNLEGK